MLQFVRSYTRTHPIIRLQGIDRAKEEKKFEEKNYRVQSNCKQKESVYNLEIKFHFGHPPIKQFMENAVGTVMR